MGWAWRDKIKRGGIKDDSWQAIEKVKVEKASFRWRKSWWWWPGSVEGGSGPDAIV